MQEIIDEIVKQNNGNLYGDVKIVVSEELPKSITKIITPTLIVISSKINETG